MADTTLAYFDTFEDSLEGWLINDPALNPGQTVLTYDHEVKAAHVKGKKGGAIRIEKKYQPSANSLWQKLHFEFRIRQLDEGPLDSVNLWVEFVTYEGDKFRTTPRQVYEATNFGNRDSFPNTKSFDSGWLEANENLRTHGLRTPNPTLVTVSIGNSQPLSATPVEFWIRNFYVTRDTDADPSMFVKGNNLKPYMPYMESLHLPRSD